MGKGCPECDEQWELYNLPGKTYMTVDEAIRVALENVKNPYALGYLRAIPSAIEEGGDDLYREAEDSFRLQLSYALNNMKGWRGEKAREVKGVLRGYVKQ